MKTICRGKCSRTLDFPAEAQSVHLDLHFKRLLCLGGRLLLMSCLAAKAQDFSIDWWDISAGGTSTGGIYTVSGSIGQPDAGTLAGGDFVLTGGFWSAVVLGQPPVLRIALTSTNTVLLTWPSASTGFVLQECTDLNQALWSGVEADQIDNGTIRSVVLPMPPETCFYRLKR